MKLLTKTITSITVISIGILPNLSMALNPTESVPDYVEAVAYMKPAEVAASPVAQMVIDHMGRDQIVNTAKFVKNATGLDMFQDIHEVWIFGLLEDDNSNVVFARGKYDQEKILDMVRLNETYQLKEYDSYPVHSFSDEDGLKVFTFVDDYLILTKTTNVLSNVIGYSSSKKSTFANSERGERLLRDHQGDMAWGALLNQRNTKGNFGELARSIDLSYLDISFTAGADTVTAELTVVPEKETATIQYREAAEGMIAMSTLLQEEFPIARTLAETAEITSNESGDLVIRCEMPNQQFLVTITEIGNH